MSEPVLRIEKSEGIATLTLNRPEARNALNRALRDAIREAFAALHDDDAIGAVILTGAGSAFCAGLDLKELSRPGTDRGSDQPQQSAHDIVRAKAVSLSGNFVSAEEAERWGLLARVVAPAELLPACRALARDMLSCEPRTLRGYKRLIDETFGMTAAEARRHEARASTEHMKSVTPADVAARRQGVVARGREQTRG